MGSHTRATLHSREEILMELTYPYSPNADWRIAISRRFNLPAVDSLYSTLILPVLESEGLILECSYASESVVENDFWMNRIDIMLGLADIHVLMDIDRSPNVEFEFERSAKISRSRQASGLLTNLGWTPLMSHRVLFMPITITIKRGAKRDKLVRRRRMATLYLPEQPGRDDFKDRLKGAIRWAKALRLKQLNRMRSLFEKRVRLFGIAENDLEFGLVMMTALAKRLKDGETIDDLLPTAEEIEVREKSNRQRINESFEWRVKLKKGEFEIPDRFRDTYIILRDHYTENIGSIANPEFVKFRLVRWLIAFGALVTTIKARKRKRLNQSYAQGEASNEASAQKPDDEPEATELCSFCGKSRYETAVILEHDPVYICCDCVRDYIATLDEISVPKEQVSPCSFCANGYPETARIVEGEGVRICNVCLNICHDIAEDTVATET